MMPFSFLPALLGQDSKDLAAEFASTRESNRSLRRKKGEISSSDSGPRTPAAEALEIITIPQIHPIFLGARDESAGHVFDHLKHLTLPFAIGDKAGCRRNYPLIWLVRYDGVAATTLGAR